MSGRRLVLLRHGQTGWNAIGRGQGHSDVHLDETGHAQSALAATAIAAYHPVVLWSSDLARCRETAAYVAEKCGLSPVYDARLREFDLGERTGLTMAEFEEGFPEEYAAFRAGNMLAVPGGESVEDVAARMLAAVGELLEGLAPGESAVVLSHGGALKVALAGLLGWTVEAASSLHGMATCGWAVLDEEPETGRLRLTAYNLTA